LESKRIRLADRFPHYIRIRVDAASKPNWIALHIAPEPRIEVPEVVVGEVGLFVEVLAREAQVAFERPEPRWILIRR
jgi:hypothetical protein